MNLATASREYATRPADERFESLDALIANALVDKNHSAERTYSMKDLAVVATPDATLTSPAPSTLMLASPRGQAEMTHWAFGQLARTVGAPAGYLRELPPQLAADCLNYGLTDSPAGSTLNLLVRGANGQPPRVRAATSETYGRVWDADLYRGIADQIGRYGKWELPPTWEGPRAGAYRGDRDSFLLLTNGGSIVTDPSLTGSSDGTMFRGLLVRNSEVGAASISIDCVLYRYICGNHMIWGAVIDSQFKRRHVGARVLRDTIREIGHIAMKWADHSPARDAAIIKSLIDHNIATTKEGVIDALRAMGATQEQAANAYATCERTEQASPRSFWGIAQGLTRDSQQTQYQDDRLTLDRLAAQVMARGAKLVAA